MSGSRIERDRRARGWTAAVVWLLLGLVTLPPIHFFFPEANCQAPAERGTCLSLRDDSCAALHSPAASTSLVLRAGPLHSLLDCQLCRELLHVTGTPGPVTPDAVTLALAPESASSPTTRPTGEPPIELSSPRAPPSLLA